MVFLFLQKFQLNSAFWIRKFKVKDYFMWVGNDYFIEDSVISITFDICSLNLEDLGLNVYDTGLKNANYIIKCFILFNGNLF